MHKAILDFMEGFKREHPGFFSNKRILDMGSRDINGTPRHLFEGCEYVGVDKDPGPGVDVVSFMHEYDDGEGFDVVVTNGALEHDKFCDLSVANGWRLLKPGGLFLGSAAGVNFPKHNLELGVGGHYQSISREMVEEWSREFKIPFEITEARGYKDIFFTAFKPQKSRRKEKPADDQLSEEA